MRLKWKVFVELLIEEIEIENIGESSVLVICIVYCIN